MRVAHLVESFSPLTESWLYQLIVELQAHGVENHVITMKRVNHEQRPFDRVHVVELPPRFAPERILASIKTRLKIVLPHEQYYRIIRKRIRLISKKIKPDVVYAHFGTMGVLAAPITCELHIPLCVSFLGYDISRLLTDDFWKQAYQNMTACVSGVVGPSNHICDKLIGLGFSPAKVKLLHWGIDISKFTYQNPAQNSDGQQIQCLHIGTLNHKKSPLHLIRAFAIARQQLQQEYDLRLSIAGDGLLRSAAEALTSQLQLTNVVTFLGAVSHMQIPELLRKSHIYTQHCVTAPDGDEEGQGVTFVEASASGLPIVSTRHNGIPDVVLDGVTGYLVAEGDVQAMAERIVYLARNPHLWTQFGKAGREHIENNFDLTKQAAKTKAFLQSLGHQ